MRSWSILLWLKRLVPLVVIAAGIMGYQNYRDKKQVQHLEQDRQMAQLTARVWLASAVFREHPDKYLTYRDSVLVANAVSVEKVNEYLKAYGDDTEEFNSFTLLVKQYVDSLGDQSYWQDQIDALQDTLSDK